jgi:HlyD family type I secretion membrane fusion protein
VDQLRTVGARVYELGEQLAAAEDVLKRTEIRSPIDGTVVGLKVHTVGGVVAAGQPLLDIVPSNDALVVEASIDPSDIDQVRAGLSAQVQFTAFNRRTRTPIDGEVRMVSADRLTNPQSGLPYYLARIRLRADSPGFRRVTLQPGMSADVMIRTGARTPVEYLLAPITRSLDRALREN